MEEWIPAGCVYFKVRPSSTTPLPAVSAAFAKKRSQVKAAVGWVVVVVVSVIITNTRWQGDVFMRSYSCLRMMCVLAVRGRWESSTQKVNDCRWG